MAMANQKQKGFRIEGKSTDTVAKKVVESLMDSGSVKGNVILWKSNKFEESGHIDYTIFTDERSGRRSIEVLGDDITIRQDSLFHDKHYALHKDSIFGKVGMIYMSRDRVAYNLSRREDPQVHQKFVDIDVKALLGSGKLPML